MAYYLRSMIKYWNRTWKMMLHFVGEQESIWSEISVDELYQRIKSDNPPLLIDIRSTSEFNGGYGYLPNAISIPMLKLESKLDELEEFKKREIITMCPGGGMSLIAYEILTEAGFKNVKSLTGGTDLWHKKGYPLTNQT